jgi:serine/threonine protein kinase
MAAVLGEGRCGKVFEGTLRGERVAIKLCDLWQHPELHDEMLREAGVYVELGKLQGRGIPELKGVGYTAGGLLALMTEFGGSPMEVENLNDQKRRMIKGVLASIHGEGYLHGDLRSDNILVEDCHGGPRVKIIDFGFSWKFCRRKESKREMAVLKKLIGCRPIKKTPPCIIFFFFFFGRRFVLCLAFNVHTGIKTPTSFLPILHPSSNYFANCAKNSKPLPSVTSSNNGTPKHNRSSPTNCPSS